eukprot:5427662-Pyramimonas_sp.AAC.2
MVAFLASTHFVANGYGSRVLKCHSITRRRLPSRRRHPRLPVVVYCKSAPTSYCATLPRTLQPRLLWNLQHSAGDARSR